MGGGAYLSNARVHQHETLRNHTQKQTHVMQTGLAQTAPLVHKTCSLLLTTDLQF